MVMDLENKALNQRDAFERLIEIIKLLRHKCPWDIEQTHKTLRSCIIEESYEVVEAIDNSDMENLREELGDVLLQVVFHGVLGEESNKFTITDIINEECEKMIRRHPHVFLREESKSVDKVIEKWENIKVSESQEKRPKEIINNVPKSFPALLRAYKIQKKEIQTGLRERNFLNAYKKVEKESKGLASLNEKNKINTEDIGKLLMAIVELTAVLGIEPEGALRDAIEEHLSEL